MQAPSFKPGEVKTPKPKPVQLEAKVAPPAYRSFNHVSGTVSSGRLRYTDVYSFAWWRGGDVEAPVRLELSEDTGSLFTETRIQVDYLPSRTRDFGQSITLSAEGRPEETLYQAQIRRLEDRELTSVGGETMISRLQTYEPETLRLKGPFTPKTALETMLRTWQRDAPWLRFAAVGDFFIQTDAGLLTPQLGALILEQPTDLSASKTSAYGWLERFFKLFAEYRFRINQAGLLSVVGPRVAGQTLILGTRAQPLELTSTLYTFEPEDDSAFARNQARNESNTPRARAHFGWGARRVTLRFHVGARGGDVHAYAGVSLSAGQTRAFTTASGYTVSFTLQTSSLLIDITDTDIGVDYTLSGYVEVEEAAPEAPVKTLNARDVGFDLSEVTDVEGVVNRCSVTSQGYEFVAEAELLEPSYALFRDDSSDLDDAYSEPEDRKKITSVWSAPEGTIIGGDKVTLAINIEAYDAGGSLRGFGIDETLEVGESKRIVAEHRPNSNFTQFEIIFYLRFTGTEVQLYGESHRIFYQSTVRPSAWIVLLNAAGEKFARSNEKVFAQHDESQGSPYGTRRDDIDAGPFPLSYETALAIAERRVAQAKEPKTVVSFEQSPRLPVLPDDLHKTLELPGGRRGVVTSWSYAEAHTPQGSLSKSSVKVRLDDE